MGRQGTRRTKGRRDALVVIGRHLLGQIGHIKELRKHVVHVTVLPRRALDEDTRRPLRVTKRDRLLCLDRSIK